jgi:hypothetical protein
VFEGGLVELPASTGFEFHQDMDISMTAAATEAHAGELCVIATPTIDASYTPTSSSMYTK